MDRLSEKMPACWYKGANHGKYCPHRHRNRYRFNHCCIYSGDHLAEGYQTQRTASSIQRCFCSAWRPRQNIIANRTWLWIGSILVISNFFWQLYIGTYLASFFEFGAALWCTCLLACFRPIRWGYVAEVVTLINSITLIIIYIQSQSEWIDLNLATLSLFYTGNAILAASIAYLRQRISAIT